MSGEAPEHSQDGARRKPGTAQFPVGRSQLPFIAGMTSGHHRGHTPFYIGRHHLVFIFVLKRL